MTGTNAPYKSIRHLGSSPIRPSIPQGERGMSPVSGWFSVRGEVSNHERISDFAHAHRVIGQPAGTDFRHSPKVIVMMAARTQDP